MDDLETSERSGLLNSDELSQEITDEIDLIKALYAEFMGSFLLIVFGLGAVYASAVVTFDVVTTDRLLMISLAYGMTYGAIMYSLSFPASTPGARANVRHLNPAVTFALWAGFKISLGQAGLYWLAQFVGMGCGVLMLFWATPMEKKNVLTSFPIFESVEDPQIWLMETATSYLCILVLMITSFGHMGSRLPTAVKEDTPQTQHEINCILACGVVTVCAAVGGPVSGGYMNPLFPVGISILSGDNKIAPLVGPFLGGALAILTGTIFGYNTPLLDYLRGNDNKRR